MNAKGKPLKRDLRNGEEVTIVRTFFERVKDGAFIPGDERLVIVVTPRLS